MISIIIPCYNEQDVLPVFFDELLKVTTQMMFYDFEFIFINDGSKDKTLTILKDLAKNDERVIYISFSKNFGKESAILAGLKNSSGDFIAVMDADMQDPPDLLPEMMAILEEKEYDSVATRRITRAGEPAVRSFFSKMFYKLINKISETDIVDGARDFRLMKRQMVTAALNLDEYNRFSKGIFSWIGFKTYWLPYKNIKRVAGETKWSFWKLFKYSVDGIINFSQLPLTIASWSGMLLTIISFLMIGLIIIRKLAFGDPVVGWTSLTCIITFIGGVELFCMGIVGQYISKMYLEVKKRPHYIINDTNKEEVKIVG